MKRYELLMEKMHRRRIEKGWGRRKTVNELYGFSLSLPAGGRIK